MAAVSAGLVDCDCLAQIARVAVKNQNLIVLRDNRIPAAALGKCSGVRAIRQGDPIREFHIRLLEADDKERDDH